MDPLFQETCPANVNEFTYVGYNDYLNLRDAEVLVELVENQVILPVVGYRQGPVVYALTFHEDVLHIERVEISPTEIIAEVQQTFRISEIEHALDHLLHMVRHAKSLPIKAQPQGA